MTPRKLAKATAAAVILLGLAGCGAAPEGGREFATDNPEALDYNNTNSSTIWDLFKPNDTGVNVKVNKYIWNASLEVLNFLPVQSVDPFTGVIVTGYGTPPGGGRSYRATIYIKDPALDARSLNVALQTRGGRPVSTGTTRAIEDAILARARQLRIADGKI